MSLPTVPRSHFSLRGVELCWKLHKNCICYGWKRKKIHAWKKGPKFITTKLLFLNKKHNRTTRITGVQKWVRKKGLERPLFFNKAATSCLTGILVYYGAYPPFAYCSLQQHRSLIYQRFLTVFWLKQ